jgi:predicted small lipoprotein YifL
VARVLLLLVLALTACSADEPTAVPPPDHAQPGADVDSAADRRCVDAGQRRELPPAVFTGSSSITLAEVRAVPGAVPQLAGGPYDGLPDTHPVDACFYDDGRTITSLLVDGDGRVAVNPAVPQG